MVFKNATVFLEGENKACGFILVIIHRLNPYQLLYTCRYHALDANGRGPVELW